MYVKDLEAAQLLSYAMRDVYHYIRHDPLERYDLDVIRLLSTKSDYVGTRSKPTRAQVSRIRRQRRAQRLARRITRQHG